MDKQKILIVDHDLLVISELAGFLWDEPYELCLAGYGIEGLEILRREEIDLAVVELHVEGIDAITLLKHVKEEKIQTAMLIMTSLRSAELGEQLIKAGAASVFDKPIERDVFLTQVKRYMSPQDMWKTRFEVFLEDHYSNTDLKFEDAMRYFRFSKSHGYALFKKHLGKTFREALREVRTEKAKSLIEETPLPIFEIAAHSGFRSSSRLNEAFKRLYGMSPRAYREKEDVRVRN